jgi:hypothetical protein
VGALGDWRGEEGRPIRRRIGAQSQSERGNWELLGSGRLGTDEGVGRAGEQASCLGRGSQAAQQSPGAGDM